MNGGPILACGNAVGERHEFLELDGTWGLFLFFFSKE